jgi:hypothetical protein
MRLENACKANCEMHMKKKTSTQTTVYISEKERYYEQLKEAKSEPNFLKLNKPVTNLM